MSEYAKKLQNPKWQKKRLTILDRDDFVCQSCFDYETTLHVHHCYYEWGKDPWDYDDDSLVTLCSECHQYETEYLKDAKKLFLEVFTHNRFLASHYDALSCSFYWLLKKSDKNSVLEDLCDIIEDVDFLDTVIPLYHEHRRKKRGKK